MKDLIYSFFTVACAVLIFSSCGPGKTSYLIPTDSLSIARGQLLFNQNCSGCHGFNQDGIGPNLSGVTETDSINWLKQFIRAPKSLIESGDEHAKKISGAYHTLMPSFTDMKDEEMDQLIAFLNSHKGRKKE
jgi:mono/diheme cytochrome c family protein